MRRRILGGVGLVIIACALTLISWKPIEKKPALYAFKATDSTINESFKSIYDSAELSETGLSFALFERAATGFYNLRSDGKATTNKSVLSIVDFDQNSTEKRLWIIDLDKKELILNTWVAHGEFSGADKASHFSNAVQSLKSSIGFYITGEKYYGKHGLSLRLDGMDDAFNSNARKRAIVVHGAEYVSQGTINALGRLGRSQGCPAVPQNQVKTVVTAMEGKTVLFINNTDEFYTSKYLANTDSAVLASK
jgi:hypothetical protein